MPADPRQRVSETTDDAILDGKLRLRQPRKGHRVGHDAVLLAAATAARPGEHAVDLGAGVGAAGLALASRVERLRVSLVEIDPKLAALAAFNAERNGLGMRVRAMALDVAALPRAFAEAGLEPGCAHRVLMNPPFNDSARLNPSPRARRRLAHAATPDLLAVWLRTAARLLRPHGVVNLIWRADGLDEVLKLLARGFGGVALMPVHPRQGMPAIRILVRAVKQSRAPLTIYPALTLNDAEGHPASFAEAVLRGRSMLPLAEL
ncbi:MAG TPA: methyltransferase [Xanthobacteraceae bacterium]|nr:methyltransferase [Xanthobacteraceae bacterium]